MDDLSWLAAPNTAAVINIHGSERRSLVRAETPGGNHTVANATRPTIALEAPRTRPTDSSPCSNGRNVWVRDSFAIHESSPGLPATAKSRTQDPMVTASAIIAAVAALSEIDAENSASAPIRRP